MSNTEIYRHVLMKLGSALIKEEPEGIYQKKKRVLRNYNKAKMKENVFLCS